MRLYIRALTKSICDHLNVVAFLYLILLLSLYYLILNLPRNFIYMFLLALQW